MCAPPPTAPTRHCLRTMASEAFMTWTTTARRELDEILAAHAAVGGTRPGRRTTTQQLNYSYAMRLAAQSQRFFRDLHTEAAGAMLAYSELLVGGDLAAAILGALTRQRFLDRGNPTPGNIGADFAILGLTRLWDDINGYQRRNARRKALLEELMAWRNAIAHEDFSKLTGARLTLATVQGWRRACHQLAASFDCVVADRVGQMVGTRPW